MDCFQAIKNLIFINISLWYGSLLKLNWHEIKNLQQTILKGRKSNHTLIGNFTASCRGIWSCNLSTRQISPEAWTYITSKIACDRCCLPSINRTRLMTTNAFLKRKHRRLKYKTPTDQGHGKYSKSQFTISKTEDY